LIISFLSRKNLGGRNQEIKERQRGESNPRPTDYESFSNRNHKLLKSDVKYCFCRNNALFLFSSVSSFELHSGH